MPWTQARTVADFVAVAQDSSCSLARRRHRFSADTDAVGPSGRQRALIGRGVVHLPNRVGAKFDSHL